jgi:hypothetical protein
MLDCSILWGSRFSFLVSRIESGREWAAVDEDTDTDTDADTEVMFFNSKRTGTEKMNSAEERIELSSTGISNNLSPLPLR